MVMAVYIEVAVVQMARYSAIAVLIDLVDSDEGMGECLFEDMGLFWRLVKGELVVRGLMAVLVTVMLVLVMTPVGSERNKFTATPVNMIIREDCLAGEFGKPLWITWSPGRTLTVILSRVARACRRSLISTW